MKKEKYRLTLFIFFGMIIIFIIIILAFTAYFSNYYSETAIYQLKDEYNEIVDENKYYIESGNKELDEKQSEYDKIYDENSDIWSKLETKAEDEGLEDSSFSTLVNTLKGLSIPKMEELQSDAKKLDELNNKINELFNKVYLNSETYNEYVAEDSDEDEYSIFDSAVTYIFLNEDGTKAEYSYTKSEDVLIDFNRDHPLNEGIVNRFKKDGYDFFYTTAHTEYLTNSEKVIIYINAYPVFNTIDNMKIIFVIIGIFFTITMSILFFYLGWRIDKSNETQKIFFQNASHELKTPLMSIQGYTEGIQTGILNPKDSADIIMEETDRMTNLVQELLSISKIDSNQMKLNLEECDLTEILYDSLRSFEINFKKQNIEPELQFEDEELEIKCDELQIRKVFTNIISNALRYADKQIIISCKKEKNFAVITISDDGYIPEKDLEHVFERFYTGKNGKSGIGLAISKEIVRLHKGTLKAFKNNGLTVFEIKIHI